MNKAANKLDKTFMAIGHPTRRAILGKLEREGSASVSFLAKPFQIKLAAVMKHLDVLSEAGLIVREKTGRVVTVSLDPKPLKDARAWLIDYERFWETRLDRLALYVEAKGRAKHE